MKQAIKEEITFEEANIADIGNCFCNDFIIGMYRS